MNYRDHTSLYSKSKDPYYSNLCDEIAPSISYIFDDENDDEEETKLNTDHSYTSTERRC